MRTKPTYEELEAKCQLQQNKLDAINNLMGVIEGASDLAKSGIEKLEQQLAVAISERDAAVKAEMVWEKSMMEACGEDGPASVAAEISALRTQRDTALESLRQQLAAVVAENAGLKTYRPQPHGAAMMEALDAFFEHEDVPEQGMMASFEILCCKRPPTPATDAAIANIQAQGVEMYAVTLDRGADDAERDGFEDGMKFLRAEAESVREFAAQLRQGAEL